MKHLEKENKANSLVRNVIRNGDTADMYAQGSLQTL